MAPRLFLDHGPVVTSDVDIDAQDLASGLFRIEHLSALSAIAEVEHGQHRSAEDQRAAMSDAGLNNEVGFGLPDQLADCHHVSRHLNDRASEPGKIVHVAFAK